MLDITQILSFEISTDCNLSERHKHVCPINKMIRGDRELTDTVIVNAVKRAHEVGFTGMVAFHFYNEPMLHYDRMFKLMDKIRAEVPQCRFILWTNGTILIKDPHLQMFERTYVSNYFELDGDLLSQFFNGVFFDGKGEAGLDSRLKPGTEKNLNACRLPYHDMQINNAGEMHLCCYDWNNNIKIGNIFDTDIVELAKRREEIIKTIDNGVTEEANTQCKYCKEKLGFVCEYDKEICARANQRFNK